MLKKIIIQTSFILAATILFSACGMMDDNPSGNSSAEFIALSPEHNADYVSVDNSITITFAAPVDPKVIEENFTLICERDISDETCPEGNTMGHSNMNKAMEDISTMEHLSDVHNTQGSFKWNSDNTFCEFIPNSKLLPNSRYMIYIDSEMTSHMRNIMNENERRHGMNMQMMDCDCMNASADKSRIMTHFITSSD